jgi:hypothetical protein
MDMTTEIENNSKYIIMRDDKPISNEELSFDEAKKELERWQNILKRWPDGTKVRMEPKK